MSWEVKHTEKVGKLPHLIRQLHLIAAEMVTEGTHPGDSMVFDTGDAAFYVESDSVLLGILCYQHVESQGYTWVQLSWVRPGWRNRGLHKLLNTSLEKIAAEQGSAYVARGVNVNNIVMQKVMEAEGYSLKRYTYERYL